MSPSESCQDSLLAERKWIDFIRVGSNLDTAGSRGLCHRPSWLLRRWAKGPWAKLGIEALLPKCHSIWLTSNISLNHILIIPVRIKVHEANCGGGFLRNSLSELCGQTFRCKNTVYMLFSCPLFLEMLPRGPAQVSVRKVGDTWAAWGTFTENLPDRCLAVVVVRGNPQTFCPYCCGSYWS